MFHVFDLCIYSLGVDHLCVGALCVLELSVDVDTKRTVYSASVKLYIS